MLNDYVRTSFSLPIEDPRIRVKADKQKEWNKFKQTHSDMLKVYNLIITHLISHSTGIDLTSLRQKLIYEYYISKKAVDQALYFILSGNAKDIQIESGYGNKLIIFRSPKQELPADSYCVFVPQVSLV
jgi:hypothetical protein